MCVRNEAEDLPEQLAALSKQTYQGPWEIIVCDNGSVDAPKTSRGHGRIDFLEPGWSTPPSGEVSTRARNAGVANASGDFLVFCDGDDVVSPEWLQALVDAAPFADIVGGAGH